MSNFLCSNCKKECLSEFIGTYLLVLIIMAPSTPNITVTQVLITIARTFGGIVAILIIVLGEHSGAIQKIASCLGTWMFIETLRELSLKMSQRLMQRTSKCKGNTE
ncbi:MAG TPA: hypothetical protein VJN71_09270 [Nitrososphaerales archaeon]|nr:hypothetical protein [Nitrososphaerales archaeon]